jgi:hypothetical protein
MRDPVDLKTRPLQGRDSLMESVWIGLTALNAGRESPGGSRNCAASPTRQERARGRKA